MIDRNEPSIESMIEQLRAARDAGNKLELRNTIIVRCLPQLRKLASMVSKTRQAKAGGITSDDLLTPGMVGLVDALGKFDGTRQCSFLTYAQRRIIGAMRDEIRACDWMPRLARERAETTKMLSIDAARNLGGDNPVSLGSSLEDATAARRRRQAVELEAFNRHIRPLHGVHREVVERFVLEDMTLWEIGNEIGLSESRVSQLLSEALRLVKVDLFRRRVFRADTDWKE